MILSLLAVGAGVIYRAVTQQQGRRRRRGAGDMENQEDILTAALTTLNTARRKYEQET